MPDSDPFFDSRLPLFQIAKFASTRSSFCSAQVSIPETKSFSWYSQVSFLRLTVGLFRLSSRDFFISATPTLGCCKLCCSIPPSLRASARAFFSLVTNSQASLGENLLKKKNTNKASILHSQSAALQHRAVTGVYQLFWCIKISH